MVKLILGKSTIVGIYKLGTSESPAAKKPWLFGFEKGSQNLTLDYRG